MKKMVLKKLLPVVMLAGFVSSTVAFAEVSTSEVPTEFNFVLGLARYEYTALELKKNSNEYAKVQRQTPAYPETYIDFTVVNSLGVSKSDTKVAYGVTTVYPSYEDYNVDNGDYVKLKAYNDPAKNAGQTCSVGGAWLP